MFDKEFQINNNGNNELIKYYILSDEDMRDIGFTDYNEKFWYYATTLDKTMEISFNIRIYKETGEGEIDIFDDEFGQPYDYQGILHEDPTKELPLEIFHKVEKEMKYLTEQGVISGHEFGDYI